MRAFLAVFEREIIERRLVVAVSLLLGLVSLAAPLLPGMGQRGGPEVRNAVALSLALCFSLGLALILGATILARDLAEGRLGFYFSRPIRGWALWAGKLAAAAGLALGAGLLILLPAAALDRRLDLGIWWSLSGPFSGGAVPALLWIAWVLLLVVLGHAAGVALRSRSRWLVLDLVGLGVIFWLFRAAIHRLAVAGAFGAADLALLAVLLAALLALVTAGAVQVLQGRTDLHRGHRLLSVTLWGALLAAGFAMQAYAVWVLAVEPRDLKGVYVTEPAPRGPWIAIRGEAVHRGGYAPELLLNASSGRFVRVAAVPKDFWFSTWFSADGRWAAWLEPQAGSLGGPYELLRLDLRASRPRPEPTRIVYERLPSRLALSPDGGRLAVAAGPRLTIEEVPSGRLLAAAELPRSLGRYGDSLRFADRGRVRLYGGDLFLDGDLAERAAFEVGEVRGGGIARLVRIENVESVEVSPDGARILARRRNGGSFAVFDAGTGAVLAELPPAGERSRASFLADGRLALVSGTQGKDLRIFSPAGALERTFHFPTAMSLRLGGEPAPGRLVVMIAPRGPDVARWDIGRTRLLDLVTGSARKLAVGLAPAIGPHWGPESAASHLFLNHQGELVHVDLENGRQTVIAGRPAA